MLGKDFCKHTSWDLSGYCITCGKRVAIDLNDKTEAIRDPRDYRYDILDPEFLHLMARIAGFGAKKYGDFNWHKSRLINDRGPINHIYHHLRLYRQGERYDHTELGDHPSIHLAAIAFNAMMEFHYAKQEDYKRDPKTQAGTERDREALSKGDEKKS